MHFAERVTAGIKNDPNVLGLAAGGSYIKQALDEFSDLDLVLVTRERVAPDVDKMNHYARSFGNLLHGFTGEHVGEARLLICLYDDPLLHVDIKFLTIDEFHERIENPVILFDRDGALADVLNSTNAEWPPMDHQWAEDRFWTWVHYAALKLGRGEYFEALDFLSFLRTTVLGPLLLVDNGHHPRGVRKVEFNLSGENLDKLKSTIVGYSPASIIEGLEQSISLYREVRASVFGPNVHYRCNVETRSMEYLGEIKRSILG